MTFLALQASRRSWLTMQCPTDGSNTSLLRRRSSCFWSLRRRGLFVFGQLSCDPFVNAVLRLDSDILRSFFCFKQSWSLTVMVLEWLTHRKPQSQQFKPWICGLGKSIEDPTPHIPCFKVKVQLLLFNDIVLGGAIAFLNGQRLCRHAKKRTLRNRRRNVFLRHLGSCRTWTSSSARESHKMKKIIAIFACLEKQLRIGLGSIKNKK